jgi:hypothetical protein
MRVSGTRGNPALRKKGVLEVGSKPAPLEGKGCGTRREFGVSKTQRSERDFSLRRLRSE